VEIELNTDALTDLIIKTYQTISEDMREINTSELKELLNKLNRNDLEVIENSTTQIQRYTSKLSMIGIGIRFN
jgi:hypothetical protein